MFGRAKKPRSALVASEASSHQLAPRPEALDPQRDSSIASEPPPDGQRDFAVLETVDGEGIVLIGKGTVITGDIGHCARVEIQGHLEGTLSADRVVIREGGSLNGELRAGHVVVQGQVHGSVSIEDLLDVRSSAVVSGDLRYGRLAVAAGANLTGQVLGPELGHYDQSSFTERARGIENGPVLPNGEFRHVPNGADPGAPRRIMPKQ